MRIVALCGSLCAAPIARRSQTLTHDCRKASVNHGLLRYAATQLPAGTTLEVVELDGLPMYNSDLESPAFPESVQRLRDQVMGANAILFACPEYNYGPCAHQCGRLGQPRPQRLQGSAA